MPDVRRVSTVIADDEPIARAGLRRLLAAHPWLDVVGEAAHGMAALTTIESLRPDLVFLDIKMPGLLGTQVISQLTHQPFVVFTTAHAEHAVTAFALGAVDYLLKPFGAARIAATLDRVRTALGETSESPSIDRLGEVLGKGPMRRMFVRSGNSIVPVPTSAILWFEADGDYVVAQTEHSRYVLTIPLSRLESRLDTARFVRVHRTHIVNLDHVVAFRRHGKGGMTAAMRDGTQLAVSRVRAQDLRKLGL